MKLLLGKHELAWQNLAKKLYNRIFNHRNRISVVNVQVLDYSQNYRIFNVRTIVYCLTFGISIIVQQLTFLTHPVQDGPKK